MERSDLKSWFKLTSVRTNEQFENDLDLFEPYLSTRTIWEQNKDLEFPDFTKTKRALTKVLKKHIIYSEFLSVEVEEFEDYDYKEVYNRDLIGKEFVSIDLNSADYQIMKRYFDLPETWEAFVVSAGFEAHVATKHLRNKVINGLGSDFNNKLSLLERTEMLKLVSTLTSEVKDSIYAVKNDEIIFEATEATKLLTTKNDLNIELKKDTFKLGAFILTDGNVINNTLNGVNYNFVKVREQGVTFHAIEPSYYPMLLAKFEKREVTEKELVVIRNNKEVKMIELLGEWVY